MSKIIYVCSPLSAYEDHTVDQNIHEAREFCRVIMEDGNIPICPQIYLTQFMDDSDPEQRKKALYMCKMALSMCDLMFVYYGKNKYISDGMQEEFNYAKYFGIKIVEIPSCAIGRGKFARYEYQNEIDVVQKLLQHISFASPALATSNENFNFNNPFDFKDKEKLKNIIKILKEAK